MNTIKGQVFILGDNVDTDQILPGYAMSAPVDELKKYALKGSIIPDFAEKVKPGDVIIARDNFGCGSSREQAPVALKQSGVGAIVTKSFARIFRRNAINIGLPVMTSDFIDDILKEFETGDKIEIDLANAQLKNVRLNKTYPLNKLSESTMETLKAGGLINKVRNILKERGAIDGNIKA